LSVYIAAMGKEADLYAVKLANELRKIGVSSDTDHVGRSFKAQFKFAGKQNVKFVAVIGDDEIASGNIKLKNMDKGEEYTIALENAAETIRTKVEEGQ
ncbi:MAG: histidine--tRNA ligase, partial [Clostridia bacterium]|nr:histidine--tRNA ligase [Clostridia bacterium]